MPDVLFRGEGSIGEATVVGAWPNSPWNAIGRPCYDRAGWMPCRTRGGPGPRPPGTRWPVEDPVGERLSGISVFFPCYNDAGSIAEMVRRAAAVLPTVAETYDITVVDDGSADDSVDVLTALRDDVPSLSIVLHETNRGYGGALRSGFEAATKEFVFYTDGDGQYDPGELPKLVALMRDDVGLVNGYKLNRADAFYRKFTGGTYEWMARRLFGIRIKDVDCDFRLIRTEYMERAPLTFESGAIGLELIYRLQVVGCRMAETGVHHYPRLHGRSEFFSLRHVMNLIGDVSWFWWNVHRRRALRPESLVLSAPGQDAHTQDSGLRTQDLPGGRAP